MAKTPKQKFMARLQEKQKQAVAHAYEEYKKSKDQVDAIKHAIEKAADGGYTQTLLDMHEFPALGNACVRKHLVELGMMLSTSKEGKIAIAWNFAMQEDRTGLPDLVPKPFVMLHEDE